jgi:predicted ribosome quality control (RQC) complex YloA/Tae2 family protein
VTSNYYTLAALIREIGPKLRGVQFIEAYSHRPNELRIRFDRGTLVALLRPIEGALFLSAHEERRPSKNVHSFFEMLKDKVIEDVQLAPDDRLVSISIPPYSLEICFFGSPNAIVKEGELVIETFKKVKTSATEKLPTTNRSDIGKLGNRYRKEFESRFGEDEILLNSLNNADHALLCRNNDQILLTLIPLSSFGAEWKCEEIASVNEAVRRTITERVKLQRISGIRAELLRRVDAQVERLVRTLGDMRKGVEHSNRAERHAAIGNAILMRAYEIPSGSQEFELEVEERLEKVKMDPMLNPYENAARYFERSKRSKEAREDLKNRTVGVSGELAKLTTLREQIANETELDNLLEIQKKLSKTQDLSKQEERGPAFREFTVAGGMTVLAGKNAKQNDELTLHTAKKDDIWLHARGVAGSHVVLQCGKRSQVPREAIEQAAEIAAYYSDARTQGIAPVAYTQKKYVRKPKGAAPGAVILEREEVIMVKPQIRGK